MPLKLTITLDRSLQQNNTTALTNVKYGVISRLAAFTSENKFFTFFQIAWHVVLKRFSSPFNIPEAWKRYPFRAEPPRIGHHSDYPTPSPPPLPRAPPSLFWPVLKRPTLTRVSDRDHFLGFVFNVLQATTRGMVWSSWNSHLRDTCFLFLFSRFNWCFINSHTFGYGLKATSLFQFVHSVLGSPFLLSLPKIVTTFQSLIIMFLP